MELWQFVLSIIYVTWTTNSIAVILTDYKNLFKLDPKKHKRDLQGYDTHPYKTPSTNIWIIFTSLLLIILAIAFIQLPSFINFRTCIGLLLMLTGICIIYQIKKFW